MGEVNEEGKECQSGIEPASPLPYKGAGFVLK